MKFFVVLAAFVVAVNAVDEHCYKDAVDACGATAKGGVLMSNCNAKYGAIEKALPELQAFANTHIMRSFEYLLHSTHFANFEKNRGGFEKLFRKLSDSTWADAINLIKYIGKRGGTHSFVQRKPDVLNPGDENANYELSELEALSKAVDVQKTLATDAFLIHDKVTRHAPADAELAHYIEEEFAEKHAECIRNLAGHVADLSKMLVGQDNSLSLYLFDEYLQKV